MTLEPLNVFRELTACVPVRLSALPHDHGIYALYDHADQIRYIGITRKCSRRSETDPVAG
jgi:hypothetical protein